MKIMCPPNYHHNGFVATHALGHRAIVADLYILGYFKESLSGEYHMHHSFHYTYVITSRKFKLKQKVATDEGISQNET